ncbi:TolC Outer membrane protein [Methylophilaceae bacterium]
MMNKLKKSQFATIILLALMSQSCSLPSLILKKPKAALPEHFASEKSEARNTAEINWKDFFDDPYLSELIDIALVNNKEVNIMLQRISIAENEIDARRGEYLPFVSMGASSELGKVGEYTRSGSVEKNLDIKEGKPFPKYLASHQLGLYASWELDLWQKLRTSTKVAFMEHLASIEGKNFLVTNLVAEIASSYYELAALDNQLDNLNKNIQIQENALEISKQLQKYARTTSLAVKRFEAEVKKNKSESYAIKQKITEVENRVNFLLGRTPENIRRASTTFMETRAKLVETGIPSQLLQNRPDIRKAELELEAAGLNINVAKANFYPTFSIKAGLGLEAFNAKYLLNTPESLALSVAGDMMAPLINKNAIIAQYKNANALQIKAAYDYELTIINAYSEVSNQLANIENLEKSYQLKLTQVEALTQSIDIANQLFQSARADYLEVLLTQREALEAKKELIETKNKQISAMVNLYRALGGGWH